MTTLCVNLYKGETKVRDHESSSNSLYLRTLGRR